ncbi:hypothetical protein [uncultured Stenotrophomonas sp.]|uniref:hypothetical protein n=1 Tax=uncultured Stenotrophomonas sp. TaxID=165438 RepID=UPI0025CC0019|nr:hypothetical protein [uncultured Stenotrophomonas sp.]
MQWIDDLEVEAWNTVIEELVWHLRNGRTPTTITRQFEPERGIAFRFSSAPPCFLAITDTALEHHWKDAVAIIGRFPQLNATRLHCSSADPATPRRSPA